MQLEGPQVMLYKELMLSGASADEARGALATTLGGRVTTAASGLVVRDLMMERAQ